MTIATRIIRIGAVGALAAAVLMPSAASARGPVRTSYEIDSTTPAGLSAYCGFEILHHVSGTWSLMSVETGSGAVEIDVWNGVDEFVNAATGAAIGTRNGSSHYFYPDGIYLGAPATASFTGLGAPKGANYRQVAGRYVLGGTVVAIDENGIGIVGFDHLVSWSGSDTTATFSPQALADSWCAALAG